jgi:hypothetical protein
LRMPGAMVVTSPGNGRPASHFAAFCTQAGESGMEITWDKWDKPKRTKPYEAVQNHLKRVSCGHVLWTQNIIQLRFLT